MAENEARKRPRTDTPANKDGEDSNYGFMNDFNFDAFIGNGTTLDGLTNQDLLPSAAADMMFSFSDVDVMSGIALGEDPTDTSVLPPLPMVDTRRPSSQSLDSRLSDSGLKRKDSATTTDSAPKASGTTGGGTVSQPAAIVKQTVFTVIVADKVFRMSWETLCSDGPANFFIEHFSRNPRSRTVRIDRDPDTFQMILHYLRGYQIRPKDEYENQNLMNDARYYGLKRLTKFLRQTLFLNVGGRVFRLSKDLLARDGPANFFTGPLIHYLFYTHVKQAEAPPYIIDRNPDTFAEIISHLQGYSIQIRDEVHRANLLKDAQYYSLRRLRDKLMTARKTIDGFGETGTQEVLLWLKDVRLANLLPSSATEQKLTPPTNLADVSDDVRALYQIRYKREDNPHNLLVQLSEFYLYYPPPGAERQCRMELCDTERQKLQSIAKTLRLEGGVHELTCMNFDCAIKIDDKAVTAEELLDSQKVQKLYVLKAIAAVLTCNNRLTLCMLRFEAVSSRLQLNLKREFLP
ncbi:hypothetical protein BC943DRAFT_362266 [Umbelopsis sp. AD052]|nr:hypothetical protein BC943DRAFT_362266 [Umbelopsis sp. AD052]